MGTIVFFVVVITDVAVVVDLIIHKDNTEQLGRSYLSRYVYTKQICYFYIVVNCIYDK